MQHIFIVKAYLPEVNDHIFVPDYAGSTENDVETKVLQKAWKEGFKGNVEDRLKELNWSIVRCSLTEIQPQDEAIAAIMGAASCAVQNDMPDGLTVKDI